MIRLVRFELQAGGSKRNSKLLDVLAADGSSAVYEVHNDDATAACLNTGLTVQSWSSGNRSRKQH